MKIKYKNKKIDVLVHKVSFFGMGLGLMFRSKKTKSLLFDFKENVSMAIHSYFVFFDFLAIWLDENNEVIEWRVVKPFISYISPKKNYRRLIEIPINKGNKEIIEFFVGKR
jgi:uncharacterized membrane protein (UPF0127 family)